MSATGSAQALVTCSWIHDVMAAGAPNRRKDRGLANAGLSEKRCSSFLGGGGSSIANLKQYSKAFSSVFFMHMSTFSALGAHLFLYLSMWLIHLKSSSQWTLT